MFPEQIEQLIERYLDGSITPSERDFLMRWYRDAAGQESIWLSDNENEKELVRERLLSQIMAHTERESPAVSSKRFWYIGAAAAISAVVISIALLFNYHKDDTLPVSRISNRLYKNDIPAGTKKAVLTLANGSQIILDDAASGKIGQQGDALISKTDSGKIAYSLTAQNNASQEQNTVTTPVGGEYQIVLSDGTKVWLNAATTLKYPAVFGKDSREVSLSGEAYFEVAKDAGRPFRVHMKETTVRVLGTYFNISAYNEDATDATTLLEGAVAIEKDGRQHLLKPGEQGRLYKATGKINVRTVDTEEAVAWKNGYFLFANEDIKSTMTRLSRWYDIDVAYAGDVSQLAVFGTMSRYKNISEVLSMLELTGVVKFKIEGRRVTVMP